LAIKINGIDSWLFITFESNHDIRRIPNPNWLLTPTLGNLWRSSNYSSRGPQPFQISDAWAPLDSVIGIAVIDVSGIGLYCSTSQMDNHKQTPLLFLLLYCHYTRLSFTSKFFISSLWTKINYFILHLIIFLITQDSISSCHPHPWAPTL
jgi:hypothetical protein